MFWKHAASYAGRGTQACGRLPFRQWTHALIRLSPSREGGGAQQGRRGNQNSGNREPEWSGWQSVRMGGSDNKGMAWPASPVATRCQGNACSTGIRWGVVSRSPDGLFAQQEWEPIRGRPAVRGKRTYGGRPGQRVEEQGTWASHTQKHSEAGYGRPVDRGA